MESLYKVAGISRQAYYHANDRKQKKEFFEIRTLEMVKQIREDHPMMGSRIMYTKLKIIGIGINKFEKMISSSGLGIKKKRLWIKTTNSNPNLRYKNLTYGLKLTDINQLWVSDITYWITEPETFYLVFIQDVYSRRVLGYNISNNMYAINNVQALKMAFKERRKKKYKGLIHHSDKGSQYGSDEYLACLKDAKIKISMAKNCLENPYAERLNGIMKNDYLKFMPTDTLKKLKKSLTECVYKYNYERPHSQLNYLTPVEYENSILKKELIERNHMILYDFERNKQLSYGF